MTNGFLVPVPHEGLHGAISILEQRPELPTNMCKAWAVKDVVPLISYCMCIAQCAPAQLPGDHWPDKPALLNRQRMGTHDLMSWRNYKTHASTQDCVIQTGVSCTPPTLEVSHCGLASCLPDCTDPGHADTRVRQGLQEFGGSPLSES